MKTCLVFSLVRLLWLDVINLIITLIRNCFHLIICPSYVWDFIGCKLCLLIPQAHEQEALASLESFLAKWFLGRSTTVFKCSKESKENFNWGIQLRSTCLALWRNSLLFIDVNLINCALRIFPPISTPPTHIFYSWSLYCLWGVYVDRLQNKVNFVYLIGRDGVIEDSLVKGLIALA